MERIRISVLIGIYNCAETLAEALDSLLVQTYQGFRAILCDDGSTDGTFQVAKDYADKYPDKFILIQNEKNMGLNYTLNHCLEYADTEYVARMDGDDISLPERFQKQIEFLDTHPEYAVVSTPMIYFDENGDFRKGHDRGHSPSNNDFAHGTPICHAPSMSRTEVIKSVGGYSVDKRLLRVEDYHLWFKVYAAGYKAYILPDPFYKMRDDRNAKVRRNWQNRKNEMYVRRIGFKMLGLPWHKYIWVLRPLVAHLAPTSIYNWYHRKRKAKK